MNCFFNEILTFKKPSEQNSNKDKKVSDLHKSYSHVFPPMGLLSLKNMKLDDRTSSLKSSACFSIHENSKMESFLFQKGDLPQISEKSFEKSCLTNQIFSEGEISLTNFSVQPKKKCLSKNGGMFVDLKNKVHLFENQNSELTKLYISKNGNNVYEKNEAMNGLFLNSIEENNELELKSILRIKNPDFIKRLKNLDDDVEVEKIYFNTAKHRKI